MTRAHLGVVVVAMGTALGCANLPAPGSCGNGIVEGAEACDGDVADGLACGEPDTAGACRFVCDVSVCPDGQGCGHDGVCRTPTGIYAEAGALAVDGARLALADLDGDGALDAITQGGSGISVRWGDGHGGFLAEGPLLALPFDAPFQLGELDADGLPDLISATELGVVGFRGDGARRLPSYPMATLTTFSTPAARAVGVRFDDFLPLGSAVVLADGVGMALLPLDDQQGVVALPAGRTIDRLQGRIAAANIIGGPADEFVLAFRGDNRVFVYDFEPYGTLGERRPRLIETVVIGGEITSEARLVDLDGGFDGNSQPDLVVAAMVGGEEMVFVAHNNGSSFGPAAIDDWFDQVISMGCGTRRWPLALGQIDATDSVDVVGDRAVCVTFVGIPFAIAFASGTAPWDRAELGDFDEDGRTDVIAASHDRIDVMSQAVDGLFSRRSLVTPGELRDLRVADHDGDGRSDVSMVVRGAGGDEVQVLFGEPSGALPPPVVMVRYDEIVDIETIDVTLSASTRDSVADIGLLTRRAGNPTDLDAALLFGDGGRRMVSALFIPDQERAFATVPGAFTPDAPPDDLAIITGGYITGPVGSTTVNRHAFLIDNTEAQLTASFLLLMVDWTDPGVHAACANTVRLRSPDGDLVALITGGGDVTTDPGCQLDYPAGDLDTAPTIAIVAPGPASTGVPAALPASLGGRVAMAAHDLDGDGRDELIAGFAGGVSFGGFASGLMVAPVGPSGVALDAATVIEGTVYAATAATGPDGTHVLVRRDGGIDAIAWSAAGPGPVTTLVPIAGDANSPPPPGGLAAGDLDRDGLPDLVLVEGGTLHWYLQHAR